MKVKKIITSVLMFFFVVCAVSAYSSDSDSGAFRSPDSTKRREDENCGVIIQANVEAEIYVNGKYLGKTPFASLDLGPSYYSLELRKNGYDTIKCKIYPKKRYTYVYEFKLEKSFGYINVKNAPSGSMIYIDSSRVSSFPAEVSPGKHTVKVRKFGYEDFIEYVSVENHETASVYVRLQTAPFKITNFRISKSTINPDYTSGIGKSTFSFSVTNDGSAVINVFDRYGNEVWSHNFNSFSTWEQSVTWNGTTNYGEKLPDGQYSVCLTSDKFEDSYTIKIDRSIIYPLSSFTPSGSGIGSLSCAFGDMVNYTKIFVDFGGIMSGDGDHFESQSFPVTAGLIVDFAKSFELTASAGTFITGKDQDNPIAASVSFKKNFSFILGPAMKFNIAGLMNYNFCSDYYFGFLGSNIGTGFGLGFSAGFETKMIYLGLTGEYSFGATKIKPAKDLPESFVEAEDILKYGLVATMLPWRNLKTGAWVACYNNQVLEAGGQVIAMPGTGAFCCDVRASILADLSSSDKNISLNAMFGLSYLF